MNQQSPKHRVDLEKFEKDLQKILKFSQDPNHSKEVRDWLLVELQEIYDKMLQLRNNIFSD